MVCFYYSAVSSQLERSQRFTLFARAHLNASPEFYRRATALHNTVHARALHERDVDPLCFITRWF